MGKELFDNILSKVIDLLTEVKNGRISLPDLRRPFVWKDNKVHELLDSMMKGYPIGYIMLWSSPDDYENTSHMGNNDKVYKHPDELVIDGQQRLTALFCATSRIPANGTSYNQILQVDPSHLIRMAAESEVEKQFADLRDVHTADKFVAYLDSVIATRFTDDYFKYTLPGELNSSSATSPAWYGYLAAINVLGAPMLFSTVPLSQFFVLGTSGDKNAIDKHHIFPKHYLETIGFDNDRDRNQIANFTYLDYTTNIDISDAPPVEYVSRYREKLGEEGYKLTCAQNALPENFEMLEYSEFLVQRRTLMSQIVRKAYLELCK